MPLAVVRGRRRRRADAVRVSPAARADLTARSWVALAAWRWRLFPSWSAWPPRSRVITSARTVPSTQATPRCFVVVDTSRSMLASRQGGQPTRFERARDEAISCRPLAGRDPGRNRLVHRPRPCRTSSPRSISASFRETMRGGRSGIERPPPSTSFGTNVTTLDALGAVPTLNFFTPSVKKRAGRVHRRRQPARLERSRHGLLEEASNRRHVRADGQATSERDLLERRGRTGYKPAPSSSASAARGFGRSSTVVFSTRAQVDEAAAAVRESIGTGPTVDRRIEGNRRALMPYVALLARCCRSGSCCSGGISESG